MILEGKGETMNPWFSSSLLVNRQKIKNSGHNNGWDCGTIPQKVSNIRVSDFSIRYKWHKFQWLFMLLYYFKKNIVY